MKNQLPDTIQPGQTLDVLITPIGDFAQFVHGDQILQHCDTIALKNLAANFKDEILVDADHASECGHSTAAMAWITALSATPQGLIATFKFTDTGAAAISARRYRFVSPAWELDALGRPSKLISCALTNKPNLPVPPVLNSTKTSTDDDTASLADTHKDNTMDQIIETLGLTPGASEQEVLTAIQALQQKIADLTATQNEAQADQFVEENKDKVCNASALKAAYLENPDLARQIIANCKTPLQNTPKAKVCNSAAAKTPILNSLAALRTPEERVAYIQNHASEL